MPPGRKIKLNLLFGLLIIAGLFTVALLSPQFSSAQTATPGSGTVPLGGTCTAPEQCQGMDNRCGGITCRRNKCKRIICDLDNCQVWSTGETDTEWHECQGGGLPNDVRYFVGDRQYCCSAGWTSQQCAAQCSASCPWTQSPCGGRPDWGNLGDGFGPTTCLATQKLEYNDCGSQGARNRVCKNYADCTSAPTATPTVPACPWDIIKTGTSNGKVDAADLAELNRCYSPLGGVAAGCQIADLSTTKGIVNALDYSVLLTHWGNCP